MFYSGGIGSWVTAKRVIAEHGKENTVLLFTDTKIEDEDLYRFLKDTTENLGAEFVHIEDGRDIWEVFKDVKYLGNSRIAQCSHILKQKTAENWIKANYQPDECVLYLGIDWTEEHRTKAPTENWKPYTVKFPMCEEPFLVKEDMLAMLEAEGIEVPRLYKMGFAHNNCGGGCVRAGQGHFLNLLKTMPERFAQWEANEQMMREYLGKEVSILRRQRNGKRFNFTLKELREEYEEKQDEADIDIFDIGGCGCFVND